MIVSITIHAVMLIIFFFLIAWKEPFPPIPEYGIELNFGLTETGLGEVESEQPAESESEELIESEEVTEEVEEATEENIPETSDAVEEDAEVVEETFEEAEPIVESTTESTTESSEVSEEVVEETVEKPKEDPKPILTYPPKGGGGQSEGNTQGTGNMGKPEGDQNNGAYDGTQGGGGGASLNMAGWKWAKPPIPDDKSDATGRIVFEITVDENGKVKTIKTLEKTVSPIVEKLYRDEVLKTKFIKTGAGGVAPQSKGKITFIIKSS